MSHFLLQEVADTSHFSVFFFKRKLRQETLFILLYFLRLFLWVSNNSVPQEQAECLLLYTQTSVEKLETSISSFLLSPSLELPETLSTKLKPSLFQQYLHYTGTQAGIKFRNSTNPGSVNIFFHNMEDSACEFNTKVLVRDRRPEF